MNGSEIIVTLLEMHGVNTIFGYPGAYILDIYESIKKSSISHLLTNTEQGAINACDGYARSSGKLGVVIATSGPGASNLVTGIASANLDSSPILAITGNVPTYSLGTDSFQEVDISGITMPITKYSQIVKSVTSLPQSLSDAIRIAMSGRKGAVLLDIPQDVQQDNLDISIQQLQEYVVPVNQKVNNINNNSSVCANAINLINASPKVAILVGGGVRASNCINSVNRLSQILNAPMVTTLMGVACCDNKSLRYFGLSGSHGNPTSNHCLNTADLIISLGARFNDRLLKSNSLNGKRIIQIDIDEAENDKNIAAVCFIKSDISQALEQMEGHLERKDDNFINTLIDYKRKIGCGDNNRHLRNYHKIIAKYIDDDTVIATDVGEHQMAVCKNYILNTNLLTNGGLGAMGWGLGALIGGVIAKKQQKSVLKGFLITGDGSFNMSFNELSTAVALQLPLVIIIFNNHSLAMCRSTQLHRFGSEYMTRPLFNIDYVKLAESMGAKGFNVNNTAKLDKILTAHNYISPIVINIEIDTNHK